MTTTPQAALLSDDEVAQCINQARTNLFDRAGTTSFRIARAIEQAVLAKLQPAQAGELPPLPEPEISGIPLGMPMSIGNYIRPSKDLFTADQMHAYARAALTARKPLSRDLAIKGDEYRITFLPDGRAEVVLKSIGIGLEVKT